MAHGIGENPALSPSWHLSQVDYPTTRDEIVDVAAGNEAPVEVINFFKSLPKQHYQSQEQVLRDFGEAGRRVGLGPLADDGPSRENLGKTLIEETPGVPTHHP